MAEQAQGARLADLALNAIEIIDRNLYERTCDVRWWATDSRGRRLHRRSASIAAGLRVRTARRDPRRLHGLSRPLALRRGRPCHRQRPARALPRRRRSTSHASRGSRAARALACGNDYAVDDIACASLLDDAQVATYASSVREGGEPTASRLACSPSISIGRRKAHDREGRTRSTPTELTRPRSYPRHRFPRRRCASSDDQPSLSNFVVLDATGAEAAIAPPIDRR